MQSNDSIKIIQTNSSPSHLFNNLTINDNNLYFIHNSESHPRVMSVDKKFLETQQNINTSVKSFNNSETNEMLFVKAVKIKGTNYIGIGLYGGFKLWSNDGNRLLFQIPTKVQKPNRPYAFTSLCEFIINNSNENDSIICGDNYGQIFLVSGQGSNWKSKIINQQQSGITSISSIPGFNSICATYDNCQISFLKLDNGDCITLKHFKEEQLSVTSACVKGTNGKYYAGCGFINGELKIYGFESLSCEIAIASHLRGINSVLGRNNSFVCISDDGCVNIWDINFDLKKVSVQKNIQIEDKMLVGVEYEPNKRELYLTSYDFPEIIIIENVII